LLFVRRGYCPGQSAIFIRDKEVCQILGINAEQLRVARQYLIDNQYIAHEIAFGRNLYRIQPVVPFEGIRTELTEMLNPKQPVIGTYELRYALRVWQIVERLSRREASERLGIAYQTYINYTRGTSINPCLANRQKIIATLWPLGIRIYGWGF
jgi:hypothetical protein